MIILPAESELDSGWVSRLESHYGLYFDSIYTHIYEQWSEDENSQINLLSDEEKLAQHLVALPPETKVVVFAKYAGAILAILSGQTGALKAEHCFFFGPSFDWANRHVFSGNFGLIEKFNLPTTIFHSQYDLVSSYTICNKTITEHLNYIPIVVTPGYEFTYDNYDSFDETVLPILKNLGFTNEA